LNLKWSVNRALEYSRKRSEITIRSHRLGHDASVLKDCTTRIRRSLALAEINIIKARKVPASDVVVRSIVAASRVHVRPASRNLPILQIPPVGPGGEMSGHVAISAAQGKSAPRAPVREKCGQASARRSCGQAPASRSYRPRTRSRKRLPRRGNGATQRGLCPGN